MILLNFVKMSNQTTDDSREFYCFISYKHKKNGKFEKDQSWAEKLEGSFHRTKISVPPVAERAIIRGTSDDSNEYIGRIYRDFTNLSAGYYTEEILTGLISSRKLVSIISDEMLNDQNEVVKEARKSGKEDIYGDAWCYKELRDFISCSTHSLDDVILVYIGKRTEFSLDMVPALLLDIHAISKIEQVFPDSDRNDAFHGMTPEEQRSFLEEYWKQRNAILVYKEGERVGLADLIAAKVACNIFGLKGEGAQAFISFREQQLAQEEAERKRAKSQRLSGLIIGITIIVSLVVSLLSNASQVHLGKARRELSEGKRKDALDNTLRAYSLWPLTGEITKTIWASFDPSIPYMAFESDVAINNESDEFAVIRDKQYVDIYDFSTLSIIKTYDVGHGSSLRYSPAGNKLAVFSKTDLTIIDRNTNNLIRKSPFNKEILSVCFSQNGVYLYCDGLEEAYKLPDLETDIIYHHKLPYYSYTYSHSEGSFLGTDDKLAFITKAYNVSGRSPSDTLWAISIYDLNRNTRYNNLGHVGESYSRQAADIYMEMPDSVSFLDCYSNQSFFFLASAHGISFLQLIDTSLIYKGWHRYSHPVKGWTASAESLVKEWNEKPVRIVASMKDRGGDNFVLSDQRGIKYRLNDKHEVETLSPGYAEVNKVCFYERGFLATQDTLVLINDNSGNLFLGNFAPWSNRLYGTPLGGVRLDGAAKYTIQKHNGYQFVSEIHNGPAGKTVRSFMYMKRDLRELQLPILGKGAYISYISPDLSFAFVSINNESGILNLKTRDFISFSSSTSYSNVQDHPLFHKGESVYVLSKSQNGSGNNDVSVINLATKSSRVLLSDIKDVTLLSEGIIFGHREGRTVLMDLNHPEEKEEYPGLLDIIIETGFYSLSKRTNITKNSYSRIEDDHVYNASVHLGTKPKLESDGAVFVSTTPKGKYVFAFQLINRNSWHDTVKYNFYGLESFLPHAEIISDADLYSFHGISPNEKYFYFARNGALFIYDLEKKKEYSTTFRIDKEKINHVVVHDNYLFFPGNTFKVIDLSNGNEIMSLPELGFKWGNLSASFSPNKRWLLVGENLIDLNNKQIVSNTIPDDRERILTNEYVIYRDKVIALPYKRNLIKLARSHRDN